MKPAVIFIVGLITGGITTYFAVERYQAIRSPISDSDVKITNATTEKPDSGKELKYTTDKTADGADCVNSIASIPQRQMNNISLPNDIEAAELKSAFEGALFAFNQESIDYDWANKNETGFFEHINYLPHSVSASVTTFQCREAHCLLELSNIDFNKVWGPALGQLAGQEWWSLGRIHFHPYPVPGEVKSYRLLLERAEVN